MRNTFVQVLDDTQAYLALLREDGVKHLDLSPEQVKALKATPAIAPPSIGGATPISHASITHPAQPAPQAAPLSRPRKSAWGKDAEPIAATSLDEIAATIATCTKCPLHTTRTKPVVGQGSSSPDIAFIGEGPGKQEDLRGEAFIGPAGDILTRLLTRMGYTRDDIWIGNVVKCRPSVEFKMKKDRPPTTEEMSICLPYLQAQLAILKPKVIVTMGNVALEGLFGFKGITKRRGTWLQYQGINTMPTYHPSYLLRNEHNKQLFWDVWHDMEQVLQYLGKTPS